MSKAFFSSLSCEQYSRFWPQYILKLQDVYLGSGGAIYHKNGELHPLANFNYSFWKNLTCNELRPNNSLKSIGYQETINPNEFEIKSVPEISDYIFAHHYHNNYVFGHFWDVLQDLQKIEDLNLLNAKLITPRITSHVNDLYFHLDLFNYPKENIVSLDLPSNDSCNILYKIPTLYYPSPTAYPSQVSNIGLQYLRSKYFKLLEYNPPKTKLYLRRPNNKRSVVNDKEICEILQRKGFSIIDGTEGIRKHVNLFKNASMIIGGHGSLFRNMIFSDQNPIVYEFCPSNREDHNFEGIGKTMNLDYNWIGCKADSNFNINIDLSLIQEL